MRTEPLPPATHGLTPVLANERSQWLDALRGFALFGIFVFNIDVLCGYAFLSPEARAPLPWNAFDRQLDFLLQALVQGKFYSLFSFLFGLGFAVQLRRAEAGGVQLQPTFRRRMGWLLVIGLVHATLIWWGDILSVYALFGFALLWFRSVSQRALLAWAVFFLLLPVLIYPVLLALQMPDPFAPDPAAPPDQGLGPKLLAAFRGDSYLDVVENNTIMYGGGLIRRTLRFALPRIFGMFLLGAWVGRLGLPEARDTQKPLLKRVLWCGLVFGLPLNMAYVALGGGDALLPASLTGLLAVVLSAFGIPLLSLAYAAVFALHWRSSHGVDSLLVASGRMALSNYLAYSILCAAVFYGLGLGLFGQVSNGVATLISVAIFIGFSWSSRAWLRRHAQGPMEALWRRLSYR
jgi:uncharacterized protein